MEITEVRIKLMEDPQERLQAFCSITLDCCFVVRDLKIIKGTKGPFVAMPSRKLTDRCPRCSTKNNLRALYCNQCGNRLNCERALKGMDGRAKLYADIAHPINTECRELIQHKVLEAFEREKVLALQPGYVCRYDDYGEEIYADAHDDEWDQGLDRPAAAPATVMTADGTTRRIEPAARQQPPHHARVRDNVPQPDHSTSSDDDFGVGII